MPQAPHALSKFPNLFMRVEYSHVYNISFSGSTEEDTDKVLELADMIPKIQDQGEHTKRSVLTRID